MEKIKKSKKNPAKAKTLVTLLLDRSGSMGQLRRQTVDAINSWTGELRGSGLDIRFSQVHFDYHGEMCLEKLHVARKIADVPMMTEADFTPRGMTPLIDAAMDTINAVKLSMEGKKGVKVIIAIQTDGQENASSRYRWEDLKSAISDREKAGWEFVFMGAGINAYEQGARMGISGAKTISYGNDASATREAFRSTAMNTVAYASGQKADLSYSSLQKSAAGDEYDGAAPRPAAPLGGAYAGMGISAGWAAKAPVARSLELRRDQPVMLNIAPDLLAQLQSLAETPKLGGKQAESK